MIMAIKKIVKKKESPLIIGVSVLILIIKLIDFAQIGIMEQWDDATLA